MESRMVHQLLLGHPLALIVEDNQSQLEKRERLFQQVGFVTMGVTSKADAEMLLSTCPQLDLVVTDINLDVTSDSDRSGVDVAKHVRECYAGTPIVGYSARFEDELDPDPRQSVFDREFPKGRLRGEQLVSAAQECMNLAREQHKRPDPVGMMKTTESLERDLAVLRAPLTFDLVRVFEPAEGDIFGSGRQLNVAGVRLLMLELKARHLDEAHLIVSIWLRRVFQVAVAELFGNPSIRCIAESEEEAIGALIRLVELEPQAARQSWRS